MTEEQIATLNRMINPVTFKDFGTSIRLTQEEVDEYFNIDREHINMATKFAEAVYKSL